MAGQGDNGGTVDETQRLGDNRRPTGDSRGQRQKALIFAWCLYKDKTCRVIMKIDPWIKWFSLGRYCTGTCKSSKTNKGLIYNTHQKTMRVTNSGSVQPVTSSLEAVYRTHTDKELVCTHTPSHTCVFAHASPEPLVNSPINIEYACKSIFLATYM